MKERFRIRIPMGAALLALAALAGVVAFSGCTVYREPGDEPAYDTAYDDEAAYADTVDDEIAQDFSDLDYWGQWFELYPYGTVWRPTVVMDWRPYDNGQWMWSTYGWTWVSYEPFGWATYHYGWWVRDYAWGWVWIPDYQWHPSNATWITYGDYIGWAPAPPPGVDLGDPWGPDPCDCWYVVPAEHFTDDDVIRYKVAYKSHEPKVRSDVLYHEPDLSMVETHTRRTYKPIDISLVPVSNAGHVDRIQLPEDWSKTVARYRERTEKELREVNRDTESRTRTPPSVRRGDRQRDNNSSVDNNGGNNGQQTDRQPPERRDDRKKEPPRQPPSRTERPRKEPPQKAEPKKEPKKEPQKEPEKRPAREPAKKKEPKKDDSGKGGASRAPATRPTRR